MDWTQAPPAIVQTQPRVFKHFGVSYALINGVCRVEYDRIVLPKDFRDAKLWELIPFLPPELWQFPPWALEALVITPIAARVGGGVVKTVTFLTTTSGSNQTWTTVSGWNNADNRVDVISHGSNGSNGGSAESGGGGGGFARQANITVGASATFACRAGNSAADDATANYFNGANLAASSVGIRGTNTQTGAVTTNAIGTTKRAGGTGGGGASQACGCCCACQSNAGGGGGGAAGPTGIGGNGTTGSTSGCNANGGDGGSADGGTIAGPTANSANGTDGTQYTAIPGGSTAGPGTGGGGGSSSGGGGTGGNGSTYGGGGGGGTSSNSGAGGQGLIVVTNNLSLP